MRLKVSSSPRAGRREQCQGLLESDRAWAVVADEGSAKQDRGAER